jgi:cytochrome c-type biogenesis protein CcmH
MAFWHLVVVMSAVAALFVLWPLFRLPVTRRLAAQPVRQDVTQAQLYEEHLADLDKALLVGDIDKEQYQALKLELQRTLMQDSEGLAPVKGRSGGQLLLILVACLLPVLALVFYKQWGALPDWKIYDMLQAEEANPPENNEAFVQSTKNLLIEVRARLKQQPDNHQMRFLLAERSMAIQDYDEAIAAYRHLLTVEPNSPSVAIKLAQALFVREGNKVTDEVAEYAEIAVQGAPFMYGALEMAGMVAFHREDYKKAVQYWQRAKGQLDPASRAAQALDGAIYRAAQAAVARGDAADAPPPSEPATAVADGVEVSVSLASGVSVAPTDAVFVYARAFNGAKMPLAIQRMTVADLPKTLRLDKTMAMAPGMDISTAPELELVARISKSGSAISQPGDWQGSLGPVKLADKGGPYAIEIATQIPE